MKASIITIGDEILIGQIVDTNSAVIAKALEDIGISIREILSVSDERQHILDTFSSYQDEVDLVVITGGLGPTKDDITKKTFCDYFGDTLVVNDKVLAHISEMYERIFKMPVSQANKDQALVPSKATVLHNQYGSAPGMWMQKNNTVFVSMPGVPYEMKGIVRDYLIPKLVAEFKRPYIIHKTVLTYGMGESTIAERIEEWENNLPDFIKLAYLPSPGRVRLRLSAHGNDREKLEQAIDENIRSLSTLIGDVIVGFEESQTLEVAVGNLLAERHQTLSTAESCTGGSVAQMLTAIPGASRYFKGSHIVYSAQSKTDLLKISPEVIERHSVVSAEVAVQMAMASRELLKSDYAIATTGNAGPSKDDTDKEVGIVYIAIAKPDGTVRVSEFNFGQPREKVIARTVTKSLEMLREEILKPEP
ncbi:MAG: competence/damage-inducible protein A [Flavobacterium sp.]|nr:MAG: competence/damage-inducible protein A [Flavobacterium sp.]